MTCMTSMVWMASGNSSRKIGQVLIPVGQHLDHAARASGEAPLVRLPTGHLEGVPLGREGRRRSTDSAVAQHPPPLVLFAMQGVGTTTVASRAFLDLSPSFVAASSRDACGPAVRDAAGRRPGALAGPRASSARKAPARSRWAPFAIHLDDQHLPIPWGAGACSNHAFVRRPSPARSAPALPSRAPGPGTSAAAPCALAKLIMVARRAPSDSSPCSAGPVTDPAPRPAGSALARLPSYVRKCRHAEERVQVPRLRLVCANTTAPQASGAGTLLPAAAAPGSPGTAPPAVGPARASGPTAPSRTPRTALRWSAPAPRLQTGRTAPARSARPRDLAGQVVPIARQPSGSSRVRGHRVRAPCLDNLADLYHNLPSS